MGKLIDLTGQRFGKLIVKYRSGTYHLPSDPEHFKSDPIWHCICDCGKETDVLGSNLRHGKSHSCGCLRGRKKQ